MKFQPFDRVLAHGNPATVIREDEHVGYRVNMDHMPYPESFVEYDNIQPMPNYVTVEPWISRCIILHQMVHDPNTPGRQYAVELKIHKSQAAALAAELMRVAAEDR